MNMNRNSVLLFIFLIFPIEGEANIKRDCRLQTNVSWDALRKLKAGELSPEDSNLKCYLRCFMEKIGIVDKENDIEIEKVVRHLPSNMQDKARKVLKQCKYKILADETACEKAYKIVKCFVKAHPEVLKNFPLV